MDVLNIVQDIEAMVLVQCDWYDSLKEDNGKAWITFKKRGQAGHHAFVRSDGLDPQGQLDLRVTSDEFDIVAVLEDRAFSLRHKDSSLTYKIIRPVATFENIHSKTLSSIDIAAGGLGISSEDEKIFVWETSTGVVRRRLDGHVGDVYTCRLFPSGIVILSGGADLRLKIWSAEDGSCPRTLVGHRAPIVDTLIVEQGVNVVGISKDGCLLLWSCGKNRIIEPELKVEETLTCADIFDDREGDVSEGNGHVPDEDEAGTRHKVVAVGGENGLVAILNLSQRKILCQRKLSTGINCIAFVTRDVVIVGCLDGSVIALGTKDLKNKLSIHDSDSPVTSLLAFQNGLFVGRQDGTCVWYGLGSTERVVLSGVDIDPIYSIKTDGKFIFTGARDGVIRKYGIESFA